MLSMAYLMLLCSAKCQVSLREMVVVENIIEDIALIIYRDAFPDSGNAFILSYLAHCNSSNAFDTLSNDTLFSWMAS